MSEHVSAALTIDGDGEHVFVALTIDEDAGACVCSFHHRQTRWQYFPVQKLWTDYSADRIPHQNVHFLQALAFGAPQRAAIGPNPTVQLLARPFNRKSNGWPIFAEDNFFSETLGHFLGNVPPLNE